MRTQLPTTAILLSSYAAVSHLNSYLLDVLEESSETDGTTHPNFRPNDSDPSTYHRLIHNAYVAVNQKPHLRLRYEEPHVGMDGVIKRAQELLFQSNSSKQHILKTGYRMLKAESSIVNVSVNTMVTALLSPEWEILLQRVGTAVMLHLLVDTSIFVSLPNRCLCQMTGEPLNVPLGDFHAIAESTKKFLKRKIACLGDAQDAPPLKRQKWEVKWPPKVSRGGQGQGLYGIKSASLVSILRARMFYARPNYIPKTNKIVIGLPLRHAFNLDNRDGARYRSPRGNLLVPQEPYGKEQALKARHIMRYIFPRQYGLSNPFRLTTPAEAMEYGNYMDREDEIRRVMKLGNNNSTPKRLKNVVPLVDKMIWRHTKCPYKLLLDKCCPSKIKTEQHTNLDGTIILEWMSERSIQIQTQGPFGADTTSISYESINPSTIPGGSVAKPRFVDFACPYSEKVFRYVVIVTKAIVPKTFWGSKKNFRTTMNHVKDFITGRRYEKLSLHNVMQGFSTSDCDWLIPPGPGARQQHRVSVSDAMKRRELLEEFLFWFFDSFVSPLVKTCFYVTESSAFRNRVLYFRQDDWVTLCAPLVARLKAATFSKLSEADATEILRQRNLGFSFVRLLPKETGVRPIINLRRKQNGSGASINRILQATFALLTYEKETKPNLTGASVWGSDEVYARLAHFKSSLKRDQFGRLPKLYFVKVDVQACFDTIDQGKLLTIVRDVISEDVYTLRKYSQVRFCRSRMYKFFANAAYPKDEDPHFLDMAIELASALRHTIFIDQSPSSISRTHALQLLNSHITDNIVKIDNSYYRQIVGIPQGSILSSLLCAFFYGDLERQFGAYADSHDSTLFRMTDDYLLITTSRDKAVSFLDMMNKGHPEYGCFIAKEKTMTNFDYDHQVMNVVDSRVRHFHWCGYAIDMKDLSVSADYTRYHNMDLSSTLTITRGRKPGTVFIEKMILLAKARSHIIYMDPELNKKSGVYLNIYQNFLLSAMKMHLYLREWGGWSKRSDFIRGVVQKMINQSFTSLRAQTKRQRTKAHDTRSAQKKAVLWLGWHAFHEILSRKPTRYRAVIKWLKSELNHPRCRSCEKRFHTIVRDSLLAMENIKY